VAQAQDFLGAILGRREVASNFWTGYQTMLVCDAVQQAAAQGRPVDIAALDAGVACGSTRCHGGEYHTGFWVHGAAARGEPGGHRRRAG